MAWRHARIAPSACITRLTCANTGSSAILAGGVASVLRITPTRTFSAVLVWLRASDLISVTALGISVTLSCPDAPQGHVELAIVPMEKTGDCSAHENPSHTAIATRPANASDIR
jgi:hypothetical protein